MQIKAWLSISPFDLLDFSDFLDDILINNTHLMLNLFPNLPLDAIHLLCHPLLQYSTVIHSTQFCIHILQIILQLLACLIKISLHVSYVGSGLLCEFLDPLILLLKVAFNLLEHRLLLWALAPLHGSNSSFLISCNTEEVEMRWCKALVSLKKHIQYWWNRFYKANRDVIPLVWLDKKCHRCNRWEELIVLFILLILFCVFFGINLVSKGIIICVEGSG